MLDEKQDLASKIEEAQKLHGHLGPFLVIGVKMGSLAKGILDLNVQKSNELEVTARLPPMTPFSCILDGIQATTQCTIGNRKLRVENSPSRIEVNFERQDRNKSLTIKVNPKIVEELKNRFSQGASNEELAWELASMSESQLFTLAKQ